MQPTNVSLNSKKKAYTVSTEYFSTQGKKGERVIILPWEVHAKKRLGYSVI